MIKVVQVDAREQHGTAILAPDDSVWITVAPSWWDLATWLWWWLAPADRKAWITLKTREGGYVRSRAMRLAKRHVRIKMIPRAIREES